MKRKRNPDRVKWAISEALDFALDARVAWALRAGNEAWAKALASRPVGFASDVAAIVCRIVPLRRRG